MTEARRRGEALRADYDARGWVVADDVCAPPMVDALRAGFDAVVDDAVARARYPSREVCLRLVQLWSDPWRAAPIYSELLQDPAIAHLACGILGCEHVRVLTQRMVCKSPDGRAPLPWHQDLPSWRVASPRALSIWVALDDVDAASGGLRYLSGSHQTEDPEAEPVDGDVRAGGVLIHHPLVWHTSTANRSGRWRRACLLAVADATVPPRQGEWDPARNPVLPGAPVG